jgi:hypothetical protein
MHGCVVV